MEGTDRTPSADVAGAGGTAPSAGGRMPAPGAPAPWWRTFGLAVVIVLTAVAVPPLIAPDREPAGTPSTMLPAGARPGTPSPADDAPAAATHRATSAPAAGPPTSPPRTAGTARPSPAASVSARGTPSSTTACTEYTTVGDVGVQVCWVWGYLGTGSATWRPRQLRLATTDVGRRVSVLVATTDTNSPVETYLGVHGGGTIWEVPASYNWDMTTGVEYTTTVVARRLANRTSECFARFRHQPSGVYLVSVTGSC